MLKALVASVKGIGAGYAAGVLSAFLLKTSVPDAELIWNRVSPLRVAGWILEAAHGVPLVVRSAAGVRAPQAPGSIGRLSELLGGGEDVVFSFSVLLVPISVLALVGITVAFAIRRANPTSPRQVLVWTAVCAATHGVALAVIARLSSFEFVAEGNLAPEIGLGAARGHIAIGLGQRPLVALFIGAAWGAAFAAAGGLSALPLRARIRSDDRVVMLGWLRGLGAAAGIIAAAMLIGGVVALVTGRAPSPALIGLGGILLAANATAAGIVATNGVSMAVAHDAGPFTGWERVDLLNVGASGDAAPPIAWLALAIPLVAGIVAGRFARRRSSYPAIQIALRFGTLWGLSLAVLALLLRVRVLSSFSVGGLDLGGGSAAFDPLVALGAGFVFGTIAALVGARSVRMPALVPAGGPSATWTCPNCGITNTDDDRFCVSCGGTR